MGGDYLNSGVDYIFEVEFFGRADSRQCIANIEYYLYIANRQTIWLV